MIKLDRRASSDASIMKQESIPVKPQVSSLVLVPQTQRGALLDASLVAGIGFACPCAGRETTDLRVMSPKS
jgi:hypothetical protein